MCSTQPLRSGTFPGRTAVQVPSVHPPWCPMRPSISQAMPLHHAVATLRIPAICSDLRLSGYPWPQGSVFLGFPLTYNHLAVGTPYSCSHRHASGIIYPWLLDGLLTNQLSPMFKNQCLMIIENRWLMMFDHRIVD